MISSQVRFITAFERCLALNLLTVACVPRCPKLLYPPVEHILVNAQIRRYLAYRLLALPCQCHRFGLELLRVNPPLFVLRSHLFLSLWYISRLSLCPPGGVKSNLEKQEEPPELAEGATVKEVMKRRLKTVEGKAIYKRRKETVEPVFGIIKQVLGFRQFLLRGLEKVNLEWGIVCLGYNMKRLYRLSQG
jgi:hypothetical protein